MKSPQLFVWRWTLCFVAAVLSPCAFAGYGFVRYTVSSAEPMEPLVEHVPDLRFQYNSSGRVNTVIRYWPGYYEVRMPLLMLPFHEGNVQVTGMSPANRFCKARRWYRRNNVDLSVIVECYTWDGRPKDSQFAVLYHDHQIDNLGLAYIHLDRPDPASWREAPPPAACCYIPAPSMRFNTRSPGDPAGDIWVRESSTPGKYWVFIHGWPEKEANFLVTATGGSRARCHIERDQQETAYVPEYDYTVRRQAALVSCVGPNGTPMMSSFSLAYANGRMFGGSRGKGAYVLADRAGSWDEYAPPPHRSFNSAGGTNTVDRSAGGTGQYYVRLYGFGHIDTRHAAFVTARGAAGTFCNVDFPWSPPPLMGVFVTCYGTNGERADSEFFFHVVTE